MQSADTVPLPVDSAVLLNETEEGHRSTTKHGKLGSGHVSEESPGGETKDAGQYYFDAVVSLIPTLPSGSR